MPSHLEVLGRPPTTSYQIWSCRGNMLAWTIVAAFSLELPDGSVKATIPAVLLARARSLLLAKGVGKSCLGSIAQKSGARNVGAWGGGGGRGLPIHFPISLFWRCARIQRSPHPDLFSLCGLHGVVPEL